MSSNIFAFTWKRRKGLSPALISAVDISSKHVCSVNSHTHKSWVLDYSYKGHGSYRVGSPRSGWAVRSPRSAHLYPPHTHYWQDTRKEKGVFKSGWLLFNKGDAAGLDTLLTSSKKYARFLDPDETLGEIIRNTARIGCKEGESGFWKAQELFCRTIHLLTSSKHIEKETYLIQESAPVALSDFVHNVDAVLKEHLDGRISLQHIAERLHMSVSALSHRYRRETGIPPITALQNIRIEHAKVLLVRGFPLKIIADEFGFSDAFHLSKTFKHVTGLAPRHYLKTLR